MRPPNRNTAHPSRPSVARRGRPSPLPGRVRLLIALLVVGLAIALPLIWPGIGSRAPGLLAPGVDATPSH
jgi:hypothetical protein